MGALDRREEQEKGKVDGGIVGGKETFTEVLKPQEQKNKSYVQQLCD